MHVRPARPRPRRARVTPGVFAVTLALTLLGGVSASAAAAGQSGSTGAVPADRASGPVPGAAQPTPAVDPNFIYDQLAYLATHFQRREAGYVAGAAEHTGFADYWTAEMLKLLGRFGASARLYPFTVPGWAGRPATAPAVSVEITVPGVSESSKVVVIGCHYDGEASSTESAFDDASGCAIELGVARAMAEFWRSHGLYPARTLRFVIFDAEEQGLFGSFNYVDEAAAGTLPDIVAMFNEEQSGIGYPLRFLGDLANPLMPTHIFVSPSSPSDLYRGLVLSAAQVARNQAFVGLMTKARAGSFRLFRQLGYRRLTYHGASGRQVWRSIFTPSQLAELPIASDTLGSSDQVPFTLAGIRAATIVGNFSYYSGRAAPAASYPYDQPTDTIGLMNTFADGGATQSHALSLALAVPGMLTTWMLSQPDILGQVHPDGPPIAAIDSVGPIRTGSPATFGAIAFVPGRPHARLSYSWSFGDGGTATGPSTQHAYAAAGSYLLRLTVTVHGAPARVISQEISAGQTSAYANPYAAEPTGVPSTAAIAAAAGRPLANPAVALPVPRPGLVDQVGRVASVRPQPAGSSAGPWILPAAGVLVVAVAAGALTGRRIIMRRRAG